MQIWMSITSERIRRKKERIQIQSLIKVHKRYTCKDWTERNDNDFKLMSLTLNKRDNELNCISC